MIDAAEASVFGFSPIALLEATALLVFWLCVSVWQRNFQVAARRLFIALTLACATWCVGEIFRQAGVLESSQADSIVFLGMLSIPPIWVGLAAYVADLGIARRVPWFPLLLLAPCALSYPLLHVDAVSSHALSRGVVARNLGPLLWATLVYTWLLMAVGAAFFIVAALRPRGRGQWLRRFGVAWAGLIPLGVEAARAGTGASWPMDPTPIAIGVVLLILHVAIFSGGMLDTLPISQLDLVTQLPVPILITDRHGALIDANPVARARLGLGLQRTLWRSVDEVLAEIPDRPDWQTWPIVAEGREAAQLVLLDPPGKPAGSADGEPSR